MPVKDKEQFQNLGQTFYEWYKQDKLKFIYGTDSRNLEMEIKRISELIEYVLNKKNHLAKGSN